MAAPSRTSLRGAGWGCREPGVGAALAPSKRRFFWLAPGFETETMLFGWAHGLGFIVLCIVIWVACVRRESPYTLLAATLTPVGPVGSVIGIELIERKGWGVAAPTHGG